ncbi:MAG: flagellar hook-associated protein FlgL [Pseudomonadales bacterium]
MRISTQQFYQRSSQSMGETQRSLLETQQRLSTGKQRLGPGDDPGGAEASLRLTDRLARLDRLERSQNAAETRLNAEDTALGALATNLQRVRELAVLLGNGALREGDALGIEAELRALKDEALSLANTVSPTGEALFGGATAAEDAFSLQGNGTVRYEGTNRPRSLPIGEGRSLTLSPPGGDLFLAMPNLDEVRLELAPGNGGTAVFDAPEVTDQAVFENAALPLTLTFNGDGTATLVDGVGNVTAPALGTNTVTVEGVRVSFTGVPAAGDVLTLDAPGTFDLFALYDDLISVAQAPREGDEAQATFQNQLQAAQGGLAAAEAQISGARGTLGAKLAALEGERSVQESTRLALEAERSNLDDLDYTAAISEFQQQLTALQAAQSAFARLSDLSLFNFLR